MYRIRADILESRSHFSFVFANVCAALGFQLFVAVGKLCFGFLFVVESTEREAIGS